MKRCGKVKNPCKICFDSVTNKNGLRCQGACKKWVHFSCLNYTPGKILDIKAGVIKVNCPCPDCDTGNKEEIIRDAEYVCDKPQCPAKHIHTECEVPMCPKKFCSNGKEIQCPEDCSLYIEALEADKPSPCAQPSCAKPPINVPPPKFNSPLPCKPPEFPSPPPSPPCTHQPKAHPEIPPEWPTAVRKEICNPPVSKMSQTRIQKPKGSQTNCPLSSCTSAKFDQIKSALKPKRASPRFSPNETPNCTPGIGPHSPRETHRRKERTGSPKSSPPRDPKLCLTPKPNSAQQSPPPSRPPCLAPKPQFPPMQPQCLPPRTSPPKSNSPPRCPATRSQPKFSPRRFFNNENDDDCVKSACKHSVVNVPMPGRRLSVSRSYCASYESNGWYTFC